MSHIKPLDVSFDEVDAQMSPLGSPTPARENLFDAHLSQIFDFKNINRGRPPRGSTVYRALRSCQNLTDRFQCDIQQYERFRHAIQSYLGGTSHLADHIISSELIPMDSLSFLFECKPDTPRFIFRNNLTEYLSSRRIDEINLFSDAESSEVRAKLHNCLDSRDIDQFTQMICDGIEHDKKNVDVWLTLQQDYFISTPFYPITDHARLQEISTQHQKDIEELNAALDVKTKNGFIDAYEQLEMNIEDSFAKAFAALSQIEIERNNTLSTVFTDRHNQEARFFLKHPIAIPQVKKTATRFQGRSNSFLTNNYGSASSSSSNSSVGLPQPPPSYTSSIASAWKGSSHQQQAPYNPPVPLFYQCWGSLLRELTGRDLSQAIFDAIDKASGGIDTLHTLFTMASPAITKVICAFITTLMSILREDCRDEQIRPLFDLLFQVLRDYRHEIQMQTAFALQRNVGRLYGISKFSSLTIAKETQGSGDGDYHENADPLTIPLPLATVLTSSDIITIDTYQQCVDHIVMCIGSLLKLYNWPLLEQMIIDYANEQLHTPTTDIQYKTLLSTIEQLDAAPSQTSTTDGVKAKSRTKTNDQTAEENTATPHLHTVRMQKPVTPPSQPESTDDATASAPASTTTTTTSTPHTYVDDFTARSLCLSALESVITHYPVSQIQSSRIYQFIFHEQWNYFTLYYHPHDHARFYLVYHYQRPKASPASSLVSSRRSSSRRKAPLHSSSEFNLDCSVELKGRVCNQLSAIFVKLYQLDPLGFLSSVFTQKMMKRNNNLVFYHAIPMLCQLLPDEMQATIPDITSDWSSHYEHGISNGTNTQLDVIYEHLHNTLPPPFTTTLQSDIFIYQLARHNHQHHTSNNNPHYMNTSLNSQNNPFLTGIAAGSSLTLPTPASINTLSLGDILRYPYDHMHFLSKILTIQPAEIALYESKLQEVASHEPTHDHHLPDGTIPHDDEDFKLLAYLQTPPPEDTPAPRKYQHNQYRVLAHLVKKQVYVQQLASSLSAVTTKPTALLSRLAPIQSEFLMNVQIIESLVELGAFFQQSYKFAGMVKSCPERYHNYPRVFEQHYAVLYQMWLYFDMLLTKYEGLCDEMKDHLIQQLFFPPEASAASATPSVNGGVGDSNGNDADNGHDHDHEHQDVIATPSRHPSAHLQPDEHIPVSPIVSDTHHVHQEDGEDGTSGQPSVQPVLTPSSLGVPHHNHDDDSHDQEPAQSADCGLDQPKDRPSDVGQGNGDHGQAQSTSQHDLPSHHNQAPLPATTPTHPPLPALSERSIDFDFPMPSVDPDEDTCHDDPLSPTNGESPTATTTTTMTSNTNADHRLDTSYDHDDLDSVLSELITSVTPKKKPANTFLISESSYEFARSQRRSLSKQRRSDGAMPNDANTNNSHHRGGNDTTGATSDELADELLTLEDIDDDAHLRAISSQRQSINNYFERQSQRRLSNASLGSALHNQSTFSVSNTNPDDDDAREYSINMSTSSTSRSVSRLSFDALKPMISTPHSLQPKAHRPLTLVSKPLTTAIPLSYDEETVSTAPATPQTNPHHEHTAKGGDTNVHDNTSKPYGSPSTPRAKTLTTTYKTHQADQLVAFNAKKLAQQMQKELHALVLDTRFIPDLSSRTKAFLPPLDYTFTLLQEFFKYLTQQAIKEVNHNRIQSYKANRKAIPPNLPKLTLSEIDDEQLIALFDKYAYNSTTSLYRAITEGKDANGKAIPGCIPYGQPIGTSREAILERHNQRQQRQSSTLSQNYDAMVAYFESQAELMTLKHLHTCLLSRDYREVIYFIRDYVPNPAPVQSSSSSSSSSLPSSSSSSSTLLHRRPSSTSSTATSTATPSTPSSAATGKRFTIRQPQQSQQQPQQHQHKQDEDPKTPRQRTKSPLRFKFSAKKSIPTQPSTPSSSPQKKASPNRRRSSPIRNTSTQTAISALAAGLKYPQITSLAQLQEVNPPSPETTLNNIHNIRKEAIKSNYAKQVMSALSLPTTAIPVGYSDAMGTIITIDPPSTHPQIGRAPSATANGRSVASTATATATASAPVPAPPSPTSTPLSDAFSPILKPSNSSCGLVNTPHITSNGSGPGGNQENDMHRLDTNTLERPITPLSLSSRTTSPNLSVGGGATTTLSAHSMGSNNNNSAGSSTTSSTTSRPRRQKSYFTFDNEDLGDGNDHHSSDDANTYSSSTLLDTTIPLHNISDYSQHYAHQTNASGEYLDNNNMTHDDGDDEHDDKEAIDHYEDHPVPPALSMSSHIDTDIIPLTTPTFSTHISITTPHQHAHQYGYASSDHSGLETLSNQSANTFFSKAQLNTSNFPWDGSDDSSLSGQSTLSLPSSSSLSDASLQPPYEQQQSEHDYHHYDPHPDTDNNNDNDNSGNSHNNHTANHHDHHDHRNDEDQHFSPQSHHDRRVVSATEQDPAGDYIHLPKLEFLDGCEGALTIMRPESPTMSCMMAADSDHCYQHDQMSEKNDHPHGMDDHDGHDTTIHHEYPSPNQQTDVDNDMQATTDMDTADPTLVTPSFLPPHHRHQHRRGFSSIDLPSPSQHHSLAQHSGASDAASGSTSTSPSPSGQAPKPPLHVRSSSVSPTLFTTSLSTHASSVSDSPARSSGLHSHVLGDATTTGSGNTTTGTPRVTPMRRPHSSSDYDDTGTTPSKSQSPSRNLDEEADLLVSLVQKMNAVPPMVGHDSYIIPHTSETPDRHGNNHGDHHGHDGNGENVDTSNGDGDDDENDDDDIIPLDTETCKRSSPKVIGSFFQTSHQAGHPHPHNGRANAGMHPFGDSYSTNNYHNDNYHNAFAFHSSSASITVMNAHIQTTTTHFTQHLHPPMMPAMAAGFGPVAADHHNNENTEPAQPHMVSAYCDPSSSPLTKTGLTPRDSFRRASPSSPGRAFSNISPNRQNAGLHPPQQQKLTPIISDKAQQTLPSESGEQPTDHPGPNNDQTGGHPNHSSPHSNNNNDFPAITFPPPHPPPSMSIISSDYPTQSPCDGISPVSMASLASCATFTSPKITFTPQLHVDPTLGTMSGNELKRLPTMKMSRDDQVRVHTTILGKGFVPPPNGDVSPCHRHHSHDHDKDDNQHQDGNGEGGTGHTHCSDRRTYPTEQSFDYIHDDDQRYAVNNPRSNNVVDGAHHDGDSDDDDDDDDGLDPNSSHLERLHQDVLDTTQTSVVFNVATDLMTNESMLIPRFIGNDDSFVQGFSSGHLFAQQQHSSPPSLDDTFGALPLITDTEIESHTPRYNAQAQGYHFGFSATNPTTTHDRAIASTTTAATVGGVNDETDGETLLPSHLPVVPEEPGSIPSHPSGSGSEMAGGELTQSGSNHESTQSSGNNGSNPASDDGLVETSHEEEAIILAAFPSLFASVDGEQSYHPIEYPQYGDHLPHALTYSADEHPVIDLNASLSQFLPVNRLLRSHTIVQTDLERTAVLHQSALHHQQLVGAPSHGVGTGLSERGSGEHDGITGTILFTPLIARTKTTFEQRLIQSVSPPANKGSTQETVNENQPTQQPNAHGPHSTHDSQNRSIPPLPLAFTSPFRAISPVQVSGDSMLTPVLRPSSIQQKQQQQRQERLSTNGFSLSPTAASVHHPPPPTPVLLNQNLFKPTLGSGATTADTTPSSNSNNNTADSPSGHASHPAAVSPPSSSTSLFTPAHVKHTSLLFPAPAPTPSNPSSPLLPNLPPVSVQPTSPFRDDSSSEGDHDDDGDSQTDGNGHGYNVDEMLYDCDHDRDAACGGQPEHGDGDDDDDSHVIVPMLLTPLKPSSSPSHHPASTVGDNHLSSAPPNSPQCGLETVTNNNTNHGIHDATIDLSNYRSVSPPLTQSPTSATPQVASPSTLSITTSPSSPTIDILINFPSPSSPSSQQPLYKSAGIQVFSSPLPRSTNAHGVSGTHIHPNPDSIHHTSHNIAYQSPPLTLPASPSTASPASPSTASRYESPTVMLLTEVVDVLKANQLQQHQQRQQPSPSPSPPPSSSSSDVLETMADLIHASRFSGSGAASPALSRSSPHIHTKPVSETDVDGDTDSESESTSQCPSVLMKMMKWGWYAMLAFTVLFTLFVLGVVVFDPSPLPDAFDQDMIPATPSQGQYADDVPTMHHGGVGIHDLFDLDTSDDDLPIIPETVLKVDDFPPFEDIVFEPSQPPSREMQSFSEDNGVSNVSSGDNTDGVDDTDNDNEPLDGSEPLPSHDEGQADTPAKPNGSSSSPIRIDPGSSTPSVPTTSSLEETTPVIPTEPQPQPHPHPQLRQPLPPSSLSSVLNTSTNRIIVIISLVLGCSIIAAILLNTTTTALAPSINSDPSILYKAHQRPVGMTDHKTFTHPLKTPARTHTSISTPAAAPSTTTTSHRSSVSRYVPPSLPSLNSVNSRMGYQPSAVNKPTSSYTPINRRYKYDSSATGDDDVDHDYIEEPSTPKRTGLSSTRRMPAAVPSRPPQRNTTSSVAPRARASSTRRSSRYSRVDNHPDDDAQDEEVDDVGSPEPVRITRSGRRY